MAYGEEMSFTAPLVTNPPTTVVKGARGGWARHAVSLRFVATAAPDGAPVAYTEYRVASGKWIKGTRVTIKRQGATKVSYRSADTLGNIETAKTCTVRVDSVAPVVHDYGSPVTWQGGIMQLRLQGHRRHVQAGHHQAGGHPLPCTDPAVQAWRSPGQSPPRDRRDLRPRRRHLVLARRRLRPGRQPRRRQVALHRGLSELQALTSRGAGGPRGRPPRVWNNADAARPNAARSHATRLRSRLE